MNDCECFFSEINISKLNAGERQLIQALKLFFLEQDPVSIHTLTCAALEILQTLGEQKKIPFQGLMSFIKESKKKEVRNILNSPRNFFKHADKDPDELLLFKTELTVYFLIEAISILGYLSPTLPKECMVYKMWFILKFPHLINDEEKKFVEPILHLAKGKGIEPTNLKLFSELMDEINL